MLFVEIILPIFLIVFSGYLLERFGQLDFRTLTNTSLYLLSPSLVFSALMKREVPLDLALNLFFFMLVYTALMTALAAALGRGLKMDRDARTALSLSTVFMNVGNFGLPLVYFAFGDAGLDVSILTFVVFNLPLSTLAIVMAQGSGAPLLPAIRNTLRIPIFHAVLLALALKGLDLTLPVFLLRPVDLMGQAAIPLMLIMLGMQMARTHLVATPGFLTLAGVLRLLVAPAVAWFITPWFGLEGLARQVVVLQTSTPAAVLPLLYSLRFGARPDLVAGAIFTSTLASAGTLTLLLYLLK